jgi:prevent-host-death family protein
MRTATLTETKNKLGSLIARVRRGETILILDHGRPVARLEPATADDLRAQDSRLASLERAGLVKRGRRRRDALLAKAPPAAKKGASILRALMLDRGEER